MRDLKHMRMYEHPLPVGEIFEQNTPALDMYQTDKEVVVAAQVPEVRNSNEVEVSFSDNNLQIHGQTRKQGEYENADYIHSELETGEFSREIELPDGLDTAAAETRYENGILEVRIPRMQ